MGEDRKVYKVLIGKPKGKTPLGRPRHTWKNGIIMDYREIGWGCRVGPAGSGYALVVGSCGHGAER
jgi:hypothetical protein